MGRSHVGRRVKNDVFINLVGDQEQGILADQFRQGLDIFRRCHTLPVGLCGELIINSRVRDEMAAWMAGQSG